MCPNISKETETKAKRLDLRVSFNLTLPRREWPYDPSEDSPPEWLNQQGGDPDFYLTPSDLETIQEELRKAAKGLQEALDFILDAEVRLGEVAVDLENA